MIYVMCHGGTEPVLERHLPLWQAHGQPIRLVCSTNNVIKGFQYNAYGEDGKLCPGIGKRFQYILHEIANTPSIEDSFIFEYDSFCLQPPKQSLKPGLWGIANCGGIVDHVAQRYVLAPWVVNMYTAQLILNSSQQWFDLGDDWCADRLLSGWAQLANVPALSFGIHGFARNDILHSDCIDILKRKVFPIWYHGVKTEEPFNIIMEAAKSRLS